MTLPAPRPGTLEWLADERPDNPVLRTPDGEVTRAEWEARAEALASHLEAERGVVAGSELSASGRIGADWLTVSWAAAKLGAGLAGLPPGPVVDLDGALHVGPRDLEGSDSLHPPADHSGQIGPKLRERGQTPFTARRLTGGALPDSVTFSRLGRPVRRRFHAGGVAAIGATLADLVARVGAVPGTTLVASGPVSDPVVGFVVNVVAIGGGTILTAEEPAAALVLAAEHDAGLAALSPGDLDGLSRLPDREREALDLTTIAAVVVGAAGFSRDAAEDLFGAVTDVYATADTGVVAVRGAEEEHHVLLDGVSARIVQGLLEVRSPLAAGPGWVATGDRAALVDDAGLRLGG